MNKGHTVSPAIDPNRPIMNLAAMWLAAGRPAGKEPINWIRGAGRAAIKRSLAMGYQVSTDDPEVQVEVQAIEVELGRSA